ncbi:transcriptional regulator [Corynebacterium sp. P3-F1]|uniref:transcriptional regulator n=1 Tax=Corynebacterium sp. P3-F1 TaxID=3059080 RepID=UPI00265CB9D0|nr:transcriptional regulator [Corynebacterium sp. P3-F1]WKK61893.1 transcriptional regulator [Corynebacterium sp. P3-F1]
MFPKKKPVNPTCNRVRALCAKRDMTHDHYPSLHLAFRKCGGFDLPVEAIFSRTEFNLMSDEIYRRNH